MEQAANQEEIDEMLELNFEEALDPALFSRNELYYTFWRIIVLKRLIKEQSDIRLKSQLMAFDECLSQARQEKKDLARRIVALEKSARKHRILYEVGTTVIGLLVISCIVRAFFYGA